MIPQYYRADADWVKIQVWYRKNTETAIAMLQNWTRQYTKAQLQKLPYTNINLKVSMRLRRKNYIKIIHFEQQTGHHIHRRKNIQSIHTS